MTEKEIADLTTETLLDRKKLLFTIAGCLVSGIFILIIMVSLLLIKTGMTAMVMALGIIPVALLPIIFLILSKVKLVNKALQSQNLK